MKRMQCCHCFEFCRHSHLMWSHPHLNVVLSGPSFSINLVPKPRMLSVRAVYVLSPLQLEYSHRKAKDGSGFSLRARYANEFPDFPYCVPGTAESVGAWGEGMCISSYTYRFPKLFGAFFSTLFVVSSERRSFE